MFKKAFYIMMLLLLAVVVSSCSKYQQLLKSTDNEMKYEKAIEYFEQGDYYKSLMLLQQLNAVYRGTNKAEKLTYYMAYCYYEQNDYILASYYFKRYAQNFPRTDRAEECLYMNAYCYYLDSPRYSLDQSNTFTAIKELQLFINQYPNSERVGKANELMDNLRDKLEKKAFEIAELYYKMGDYQAAITSFKNILKDFPDAEFKEEAMLFILKAYYDYAINSIKEKKEKRLTDAVQAFETFLYNYPESEYLDEAGKYHKNTRQALEKL